MLKNNEQVNAIDSNDEASVRPLGRVTARELSQEEIASIAGGWTFGISNAGGFGDRDLIH